MNKENPEYLAFPIEIIPNSFKKSDKEIIKLMQKYPKKRLKKAKSDFYNENVVLELECKLNNTGDSLEKIKQFVLDILEGSILKSRKQVKGVKIEVSNIKGDPLNYPGSYDLPFIGVIMKKHLELTEEEVKKKRINFNDKMKEITQTFKK
ncbi:MAG: hypothetical protein AABW81_00240 [Nanoarchaeota archaeon]|mgnify:CR=1 FL=1